MNTFITLVQKELWENNRTLLWLPAALVLALWAFWAWLLLASHQPPAGGGGVHINGSDLLKVLALPFFIVAGLSAITFCGNTLLDERRDRAILFWRSLPVSDLTTVASKVLVVMLLVPAIAMLGIVLAALPLLVIGPYSLPALMHSWSQIAGHLLWLSLLMAPFYGAIMLLSASTQRPLLWMLLLPVLLYIAESLLLGEHPASELIFGHLLGEIMLVAISLASDPIVSQSLTAGSALLQHTITSLLVGLAIALVLWGSCAEIRRRHLA